MSCGLFPLGSISGLVLNTAVLVFRFFETRNEFEEIQKIEIEIR